MTQPISPPSVRTIGAARILDRCAELATITDEPGCITRGFLSPAMRRVNQCVGQWMREAGLEAHVGPAGNLIGVRPGPFAEAPVLVLGSHLDTVRDAGAYDGVLGVLVALEAAAGLGDRALPFSLEVIGFADEEGLRFGAPFLGSRGLMGDVDAELLARQDAEGSSVADALKAAGCNPDEIERRYRGRDPLGYFEVHIEQGPQLEARDLSVGRLRSLTASCWLQLSFQGRAAHAGTTPMALRRDPMPAAAELTLAAERLARDDGRLVATVGKLECRPGAGNVIPCAVDLSLDLRHPEDAPLKSAVDTLLEQCRTIAESRGLSFDFQVLHHQGAVTADPELDSVLVEAAAGVGIDLPELDVGAGHDALILSQHMPVTMLWVRSPGGISHHPDESVRAQDVAAALRVTEAFIDRLAQTT